MVELGDPEVVAELGLAERWLLRFLSRLPGVRVDVLSRQDAGKWLLERDVQVRWAPVILLHPPPGG